MRFKFWSVPAIALVLACASFIYSQQIGSSSLMIERLGPSGGDVRSLLIDSKRPHIAYLGGSNGRLFKSTDSGNTWIPIYPGIQRPSLVIDTLVQHPSDPDHLYAGAWDLSSEGGGLFESMDGGETWKQAALPILSVAVRGLSICTTRPDHMLLGTLSGPFLSVDGGKSWKHLKEEDIQRAESVAIDPSDSSILYVGTWRLGYKSTDSGRTWIRIDNGMPLDSDVFSIAINARNPSNVYASACSGVYRSVNQTKTWTRLRLVPDRFAIRAQLVQIDPENDETIYSGTTEGLFVSNDAGKTWTRITPANVAVNAIQINPKNTKRILIGTEYQGIMLSEDGGKTWNESNKGFIHKQISWIAPDDSNQDNLIVGIGSGEGGINSYNSKDQTWQSSQIMPGMRILSYLPLPKNLGRLAGTAQGIYWQPFKSQKWTQLSGVIAKRTVYSLLLDPLHPVIYAATDQGIFRSPLDPMNFRLPPASRLTPISWTLAASIAAKAIYAGTSIGLMRSLDNGTTWKVISSYGFPNRAAIARIVFSPLNSDDLFLCSTSGLYESKNGGIHWRRIADANMGPDISALEFLDSTGTRMIAADKAEGIVSFSQDGGKNWSKIPLRENQSPAYSMMLDPTQPNAVYIGTKDYGIYHIKIP